MGLMEKNIAKNAWRLKNQMKTVYSNFEEFQNEVEKHLRDDYFLTEDQIEDFLQDRFVENAYNAGYDPEDVADNLAY